MSGSERPCLRVGVVGAGRVGAVLGAALAAAGHDVTGASAVSQASRDRAADLLPDVPIREVPEVIAAADLVLLAVPDDALEDLIAGLTRTQAWTPGQIVVHTSGRHGLAPFAPTEGLGLLPLAIHPAMTFSGTRTDLQRLTDACFGVTTPESMRPVAEALVLEIGGEPVWVPEAARPLYHAALAHGSNHLVTLVAQSLEILASAGIEHGDRILRPLLAASLDGALSSGDAALTGPVARGDTGTVASHVHHLSGLAPDILAGYTAAARATAQRAERAGRLRPSTVDALLTVLDPQHPDQES
ncbi:Rossmann-like and DUF2520 domain-containing protein [Janibacter sp. GXQ6167]|uniref:Rossmann-like and DUF2520 domain-containing protein n=1 Tax=Janibacter sp. GXQ6167 TaxID=3240791 RepID=UPI0035262CF8